MRYLNATLFFAATTLAAQEPPPLPPLPARAPQPAQSVRPAAPTPAPATRAPQPVIAPEPPDTPEWSGFYQGLINREAVARIAEEARELAREQGQQARELARVDMEAVREMAREQAQMAREQTQMARELAIGQGRAFALAAPAIAPMPYSVGPFGRMLPENPPRAWAQNDPADSLYRAANEVMSKGDYRKAATLFKELPVKFPYSAYAADAMYWSAHALYRVGATPDLQEALQILEQMKTKYPNSRLRNSQGDVAALQTRIAGVLSTRGQGGSDIVKRALAQNSSVCDNEEAQVRSAALSALMQTDPDAAMQYATKVLARKDDCSRDLRRNAVFLIGDKRGPNAAALLISVAKNDAAPDVRQTAVSYLGRLQSDDALAALEELMKSSDDQNVQREAIRALARNTNPRARAGIKALVERTDVSEQLRITALDAFDQERATQEDVAWLQALYGKVDSPRIRSRIISAMGRLGGGQNEKWFVTLANNENESIDVRLEAVRRAGQSMDIPALGRLYDQTGQRQLRMELVRQLGSRKEPETIDKLADIAKNGTDPEVRSRAINALMGKKDDRATKVLLGLIDKPEKE